MYLFVNKKGLIPGKIFVQDEKDAENVFGALVDAQNIPGAGEFEFAVLKNDDGKTIRSWEFDNYL